jgi:hypothetical protein
MMTEDEKPKGFWQSMTGILTGAATVITAVTSLVAVLYQNGIIGHKNPDPKPIPIAQDQKKRNSFPTPAYGTILTQEINLIGSNNGGKVISATSEGWARTIDGREQWVDVLGGHHPEEAVFSFKDGNMATLYAFKTLISQTRTSNLKEFELFVSSDSPTGQFQSIGKFQTQNLKITESPYQVFNFPAVKAKYLKVRLISNHNGYDNPFEVEQFQLIGRLDNER